MRTRARQAAAQLVSLCNYLSFQLASFFLLCVYSGEFLGEAQQAGRGIELRA